MGLFDLPVILLIAFVALLVLGPKRLPGLGKSVGTNLKEFKEAVTGEDEAEPDAIEASPAPAPPEAQAPAPVAQSAQPVTEPVAQPARFDPITGQPLDPAAQRFDPVTGQPLAAQPPADDA